MKKRLFLLSLLILTGFAYSQVGINTERPKGLLHVDGKGDNSVEPTLEEVSNDFVINSNGQVSIGTITPSNYSMLTINSTDKQRGVLIPQVDLTSKDYDLNSDQDNDIRNQPVGLLVYNKGTTFSNGYYYWNGKEWMSMDSSSTIEASAELNCLSAFLDPAQKISGNIPIVKGTIIKIPYHDGNGGQYKGVELVSQGNPNIIGIINDGQLENGSGNLIMSISGIPTPNQVSPIGLSFNMKPFMDLNPNLTGCDGITVGEEMNADVKIIAVMDFMKFVADPDTGVKGFTVDATTPDGLYTVKVFMRHSLQNNTATSTNNTYPTNSGRENNVLLRNNSSEQKTIMWNYNTEYGGYLGDAGGSLKVPPYTPGGGQGNTWNTLSISNTGAWANEGIYNASNNGPEHRRYTWIDTTKGTKVAYTAVIMAGMDPTSRITDVENQKVYIKIEQVTGL